MATTITDSQMEAFRSLLAKQTNSAWWIETNGQHGAPAAYVEVQLANDPRFVFELAFEELELAR